MTAEFKNKLFSATGYTFTGMVVVNFISVLNSMIVARLLDDTLLLGKLFIIQNIQSVVAGLILFAIQTSLVTFTARYKVADRSKLKKILSNGYTLLALLAVIGTSIYYILSSTVAIKIYDDASLSLLIKINSLNVMLLTFSTLNGELLRGFQKIRDLAIWNIINALVLTLFLYIGISTFGLVGAITAYTASSLVSVVLVSLILIKTLNSEEIQLSVYLHTKETYEMIKYSFPIFLSTFITTPQKLIVATYLSIAIDLSQVGLYKIGNNLQALFINIPSAVGVPLLPMISELQITSPEKIPNVIIRLLKLNILITLPFIIATGMSIKYLIFLLYGETYLNAWVFSYIVLISLLFISMSPITMNVFLGTNRPWIIFYLDVLSAISYITFSYFLINRFGLIGVGIADLLSNMLLVLVKLIYLKMRMNVDIRQLGKPLLLSAGFILISYILSSVHEGILLLVEGYFLITVLLVIEYSILSLDEKEMIKAFTIKLLSRSKLRNGKK